MGEFFGGKTTEQWSRHWRIEPLEERIVLDHGHIPIDFRDGKIYVEPSEFGMVFEGEVDTLSGFSLSPSIADITDVTGEPNSLIPGSTISYTVLEPLRYHNGTSFADPLNSSVEIIIPAGPVVTKNTGVQGPFDYGTVGTGGSMHVHPLTEVANGRNGAFGVLMQLSTDASGIADSDPFWVVWNWNLSASSFAVVAEDFAALIGDTTPPTVVEVALGGTGWAIDPHVIPTGSGAQLQALPWTNINQIHVTFSEDVIADIDDLQVFGINVSEYEVIDFAYDAATFTATWTLGQNVGIDKLLIVLNADGADPIRDTSDNALDGDFINPTSTASVGTQALPSGDGSAGGDFLFRVNVLPGDVNQSSSIFASDVLAVRDRQFVFVGNPLYSPLLDVNASGSIFANDVLAVRDRQFTFLPGGEPERPELLLGLVANDVVEANLVSPTAHDAAITSDLSVLLVNLQSADESTESEENTPPAPPPPPTVKVVSADNSRLRRGIRLGTRIR